MKKIVLILIMFFSIAAPLSGVRASGVSVPAGYDDPTVIAFKDSGSKTGTHVGGKPYNSAVTYGGVFEGNRIYKKRYAEALWISDSKPAKIFLVKCQEAAQRLSSNGTWIGNLNQDGSCGPSAEPATWATGNYLNYEASDSAGN
jgi:hypothetical protein